MILAHKIRNKSKKITFRKHKFHAKNYYNLTQTENLLEAQTARTRTHPETSIETYTNTTSQKERNTEIKLIGDITNHKRGEQKNINSKLILNLIYSQTVLMSKRSNPSSNCSSPNKRFKAALNVNQFTTPSTEGGNIHDEIEDASVEETTNIVSEIMNFYNDHENNIGAPNNNNNVIQTLDAPDQEIEVTSNEPKEHNAQYTEQTNQEVINNNNNTTKPPLTTHLPNNGSQLENNTNGITEKTTNDNDIDMEEQTLLDFLSIGDDDNDFWIGAQQISQSQLTTINSRIRNIENKIDISRSVTVLMNNIKTTYWCAFSEQARTEIRSLIPIGHTIITEPPRGEAIVLDRAAIIISVPLGHRNEVQQQVQTKLPTKPYFKWFLDDFNATREKCLIVFDADEQQLDKIIPTNGTSIIINGTKYSLEISHPKNLTLWMGPIPPKLAYNIKASKLKIFLEGQISKTKTQVVRVYIPKSDGLRKGEYVQVHCDSEMDVATIKRFHRKIGFTRGHIFDIFTPREYAESIARKIAEKRK